jgi:hypothetical protein
VSIAIGNDQCVLGLLEDRLKEQLFALEIQIATLLGCKIVKQHCQPVIVGVGPNRKPSIKRLIVDIKPAGLTGVHGGAKLLANAPLGRFRKRLPQRLAENLVGIDSQQRGSLFVEEGESPLRIKGVNRIINPIEHRLGGRLAAVAPSVIGLLLLV